MRRDVETTVPISHAAAIPAIVATTAANHGDQSRTTYSPMRPRTERTGHATPRGMRVLARSASRCEAVMSPRRFASRSPVMTHSLYKTCRIHHLPINFDGVSVRPVFLDLGPGREMEDDV